MLFIVALLLNCFLYIYHHVFLVFIVTYFTSKKLHQAFGLYSFPNLPCLSFGAKWKASCLMVVIKVEYVC
jgi:hypothetical protein